MRKYFFFLVLVGCSSDAFVGGDSGDGGDPGDSQNGTDVASPGDGFAGDGAITDGASGGDGDGYDGKTLQPYRRAFITSKTYKPNFGGLAAADKICNTTASVAGLGGTWAAWLSTTTTSAASRLEHASVPYQLLNGEVLALNWTELTSGSLRHPIDRDENDSVVNPTPPPYKTPYTGTAWTGTNVDGTALGDPQYSCDDWTYSIDGGSNAYSGLAGVNNYGEDGGATGKSWTFGSLYNCYDVYAASLYCIEQP